MLHLKCAINFCDSGFFKVKKLDYIRSGLIFYHANSLIHHTPKILFKCTGDESSGEEWEPYSDLKSDGTSSDDTTVAGDRAVGTLSMVGDATVRTPSVVGDRAVGTPSVLGDPAVLTPSVVGNRVVGTPSVVVDRAVGTPSVMGDRQCCGYTRVVGRGKWVGMGKMGRSLLPKLGTSG